MNVQTELKLKSFLESRTYVLQLQAFLIVETCPLSLTYSFVKVLYYHFLNNFLSTLRRVENAF